MMLTAPIAFVVALVGGAVLSRPKLPELEPASSKDDQIAELKEKLEEADGARGRFIRLYADEQALRIQTQRELFDMRTRLSLALERIESKRAQAPRHLPLPRAPLTEGPADGTFAVFHDLGHVICHCVPGRHEVLLRPQTPD